MKHFEDLDIENEIIPLFDLRFNTYTSSTIRSLFSTLPNDIGGIRYRQSVIRAFVKNLEHIKLLPYSKSDFEEVYSFNQDIIKGNLPSYHNRWNVFSMQISKPAERQRLRSRMIQTVRFFNALHNGYLARLNQTDFPEAFHRILEQLNSFLTAFAESRYTAAIANNRFTDKNAIELLTLLKSRSAENTLSVFWDNLLLFESFLSISHAVHQKNFCLPEIGDNRIELSDFFHPSLKSPVKNSVLMDNNVLVLTGPNMSGKSTLLKSIALCIYLGHLGWGVPAGSAHIPYFNRFYISIHSKDDLQGGYSHFLKEVHTLKQALEDASGSYKVFALFDEMFKGTNPEDALVILAKTIRGLCRFKDCHFLISTHLNDLQPLLSSHQEHLDYLYVDCRIDGQRPVFSYKIKQGWSGLKLGTILFDQEGLNKLLDP